MPYRATFALFVPAGPARGASPAEAGADTEDDTWSMDAPLAWMRKNVDKQWLLACFV